MITIKDIINNQKAKGTKGFNTDLFKSDSENITESFSKDNYELLVLIDTDVDSRNEALKETIIGLERGEAFLINTQPNNYQGNITVSIYQKWLTLQGFNYFTKKLFEELDNEFVDSEGRLSLEVKEYYNKCLKNEGIDVSYDDILELGEYNSEYNCMTLSATIEEMNMSIHLTINAKGQLSKITKKQLESTTKQKEKKPAYKSILA